MKTFVLSAMCLLCAWSVSAQASLERGKEYYKWGDYSRALPLLQSAAKEGYGEACYLLGEMYRNGTGAEQNYTIAMRMYQRGLEFGCDKGEAELGRMYETGEGCAKNLQKAHGLYQQSSDKGYLLGSYLLARSYFYGLGTDENSEKAFSLFRWLYQNTVFQQDYKWAWKWTCMYLGNCYENGWGAAVDLDEAVSYYEKSEEPDQLYHAAQLVKRYALRKNSGWKSLLRSSVRKGNKDGKVLYEYVKLELEERGGAIGAETFGYLEQAAATYPPALKLLGDCYRQGHGTAVNLLKARAWYDKAEANREAIEQIEEEERQELERIAEEQRQEEQRIAEERQAEKNRAEQARREAAQRQNEARLAAASRYKEGDLYQEDGEKGVVVRHSGSAVLIVAMGDGFGSWPRQYADQTEGWRLPTREELSYIQSNKGLVNKYLGAHGGGQIRAGVYYWSAARGSRSNERIASNGSEISRDQSNKNYVRLVRDY